LAQLNVFSNTMHSRSTERMRMSDPAPRPRLRDWITPAVLLTAAALAAAAALAEFPGHPSRTWPLAIMLGLIAAATAVWELRRRPAARRTPVEIEPGLAAAVRAERERAGEVAAVRMLRTERPELSLHDAVQLVRNL
jgi:hypothetical protein